MIQKMWMGSKPENCDICGCVLCDKFVDGKTKFNNGSWGMLCLDCHDKHGCGIGQGKGQEYTLQDIGWVKTGG